MGVRAALLLAVAFSTLTVLAVVGHGLFVPIFFVVVGMRFDPTAVTWPNLALAGLLLLITFAVRLLPCLALVRLGLTVRQMLAAVSLLSTPLTLVVAIAAIGQTLGSLDENGKGTLIVLAVAASLTYPVLFRLLAGTEEHT